MKLYVVQTARYHGVRLPSSRKMAMLGGLIPYGASWYGLISWYGSLHGDLGGMPSAGQEGLAAFLLVYGIASMVCVIAGLADGWFRG